MAVNILIMLRSTCTIDSNVDNFVIRKIAEKTKYFKSTYNF